jgi:hypothetical protein
MKIKSHSQVDDLRQAVKDAENRLVSRLKAKRRRLYGKQTAQIERADKEIEGLVARWYKGDRQPLTDEAEANANTKGRDADFSPWEKFSRAWSELRRFEKELLKGWSNG